MRTNVKIGAWIILIAIFGIPFIVSLWLLFPLLAGVATIVVASGRGPAWMRKYLKPIVLLLLAIFVIWLFFLPFKNPPSTRVAASPITRLLTGTSATKPGVENTSLLELRRALTKEISVVRFKIQKVDSAISTVRSADSVFAALSVKNQPDQANLGGALEDARGALSSAKVEDSNLQDPAALNRVVKSLTQEIEEIELKQRDPALTSEQLVELQDRLPGLLDRHKVDPLPTKLVRLENAVRQTLGAKLDSATTFLARYNSEADQVVYEQSAVLRFNEWQARSLDLSNFFSAMQPDFPETVTVQPDEGIPKQVLPDHPMISLPSGTSFVAVRRLITQPKASYPIIKSRYLLSFRAIDIHWPSSSFPVIVANIRLPENPDRTWPWTIDTGVGADFRGVEIPQYSFIYSTPAGTLSDQTNSSLLAFKDEKLTPQALATTSRITVELLPTWLRVDWIQRNKNYLITENALVALIAAAFSAVVTIFAMRKEA